MSLTLEERKSLQLSRLKSLYAFLKRIHLTPVDDKPILSEDRKLFSMHTYFNAEPSCGTQGCIAGWAVANFTNLTMGLANSCAFTDEHKGVGISDAAEAVLFLKDSDWLFLLDSLHLPGDSFDSRTFDTSHLEETEGLRRLKWLIEKLENKDKIVTDTVCDYSNIEDYDNLLTEIEDVTR